MNERAEYIICYDICNEKRLGRIHRCLRRQAIALQYSVFFFEGTPRQLERCLNKLKEIMDEREDDIRAYPLPKRGLRLRVGPGVLPDGIHWSGLPEAWQDIWEDEPEGEEPEGGDGQKSLADSGLADEPQGGSEEEDDDDDEPPTATGNPWIII